MTEGARGERGPAENELLPDHIRSTLRRSIEMICAEEISSETPLLEGDRALSSLLRQVVGRHQVEGHADGPMPRSAVAHVERMIGVYLLMFGFENNVATAEMEMYSTIPTAEMTRIEAARVMAEEHADSGWQNLNPLWQAAYDDTCILFEAGRGES